ncbi:hypothetical protein GGR50DRAFT_699080 [Xylaria sp. CBS 124048]|nr:hypothetical protein GGR50DRAFT_699080 [Xylaria sp. CBS 124048]
MAPPVTVPVSAPIGKHDTDNLAMMGSLPDLLVCIPRIGQPFYKLALKEAYELGVKLSHVQKARSSFSDYVATKTLPPSINAALRVPSLQVSKEFSGGDDWRSFNNDITTRVNTLKADMLSKFQETKAQEETFLLGLVSQQSLTAKNAKIVKSIYDACSPASNPDGADLNSVLTGSAFSSDPNPFRMEIRTCSHMGAHWLRRATSLGQTKHHAELVARQAKIEARQKADVTMKDLDSSDVAKTVKTLVEREFKKLSLKTKKTSSGKRSASGVSKRITDFSLRGRQSENHFEVEGEKQRQIAQKRETFEEVPSTGPEILWSQETEEGKYGRKRKRDWEEEEAEQLGSLVDKIYRE